MWVTVWHRLAPSLELYYRGMDQNYLFTSLVTTSRTSIERKYNKALSFYSLGPFHLIIRARVVERFNFDCWKQSSVFAPSSGELSYKWRSVRVPVSTARPGFTARQRVRLTFLPLTRLQPAWMEWAKTKYWLNKPASMAIPCRCRYRKLELRHQPPLHLQTHWSIRKTNLRYGTV